MTPTSASRSVEQSTRALPGPAFKNTQVMDAAQRMHCSLGVAGQTGGKAAELFLPLLLEMHSVASGLDISFQVSANYLLRLKIII